MQRFSSRSLATVLTVMSLGAVGVTADARAPKQTRHDRIVKVFHQTNEPVTIEEVKVGDLAVESGRSFRASDDWIDSLSVRFHNSSDKTIESASLMARLPEYQPDGATLIMPLRYGEPSVGQATKSEEARPLAPADVVTVTSSAYAKIAINQLGKVPTLSAPTLVELAVDTITFTDHTMWRNGEFLHQDPADPTHFILDTAEARVDRSSENGSPFKPVAYTPLACSSWAGSIYVSCCGIKVGNVVYRCYAWEDIPGTLPVPFDEARRFASEGYFCAPAPYGVCFCAVDRAGPCIFDAKTGQAD